MTCIFLDVDHATQSKIYTKFLKTEINLTSSKVFVCRMMTLYDL